MWCHCLTLCLFRSNPTLLLAGCSLKYSDSLSYAFNSYSTTQTPSFNPGYPCSSGGRVSDSFLEGESTWNPFISAAPWALLDWLQRSAKVQPLWKPIAVFTLVKCVIFLMPGLMHKINVLCEWTESDFESIIFCLWREGAILSCVWVNTWS